METTEKRFTALRAVGRVLDVIGLAVAVIGVGLVIAGLTQISSFYPPGAFERLIMYLAGGGFAFVAGIVVAALGQLVGCVIAIEENTRQSERRRDHAHP